MKAYSIGIGLGLLVGNLQATNRYFGDLEATSPSGRFRVQATSPANADGPWKKPFQDKFLYRLLETGKTNEIWLRQQRMEPDGRFPREGPPVAIHVSDDGWLVIRTADVGNNSCELVAVDPAGHDQLRVDILKTLLPDETALFQHARVSSGGLQWGQAYCRPYFVSLRGTTHFCLTTWWGQRLLLDLSVGRIVTDSAEFDPELLKAEKAFVLPTLEATSLWKYKLDEPINPGLAADSPGPAVQDVITAMLMTAKLKILEAVPSLRRLESSPIVFTTVGGPSAYEAPIDGIQPAVYQNLTVRQTAQLCLRRMGLRPSAHQSTRLYRRGEYWHPGDPLAFQRETRARDLKTGMKPEEVVGLIGAPDFITSDGWEYDLDSDTPATLVIGWGPGGSEKSETRVPPKWRDGVERDCSLVH